MLMKVARYYVLTRQLRTDGTMEFIARLGRATADRNQAVREARGNAQRLKGDGRPFGVEVHEVVGAGETGDVGETGARMQFVTVFVIEDAGAKAAAARA
jgi:hypothetical protein